MTIVGIVGGVGSGKTCFGTRLTLSQKNLYQEMEIHSNIHLKNYDYKKLDMIELYLSEDDLDGLIILADEVYTFLDCRVSSSERNRIESYFIAQTRKVDCDIFFTTQFERFIDLRLSLFADYKILMKNYYIYRKTIVNGKTFFLKKKHPYFFETTIYDEREGEDNHPTKKTFDGRKWFDEYNSKEKIYPPDDYLKKLRKKRDKNK